MFKTDLGTTQECKMGYTRGITAKVSVGEEDLEYCGNYKAKVSLGLLHRNEGEKDSKLILVTATNPAKAGGGKSITTVGLRDTLNRLGKKTMIALREPSLGPVFGLKGRAADGGYTQVVPMEDINLHFAGDMHAIMTANNLISACLDNHIHQGDELDIDIKNITWKRCLDMNDRTLRHVTIGQGPKANGVERADGFNITVVSEVIAVLCLSTFLVDLEERLGNMLVAFNSKREPIYVEDLSTEGVLAMVMRDTIRPNMIQALERDPVLIHSGPLTNIAHGCSSILAIGTCLKLADYTMTEAGLGADLGTEKFLDIKCRFGGLRPDTVIIIATVRALKQHGNVAYEDLKDENVEAMLTGCENLAKHIDTVKQFRLPCIVTINEFTSDTPAEVETLRNWCKEHQHPMSLSQVWAKDGESALNLANRLVELCAKEDSYAPLYDVEQNIKEKITVIATKVYGAEEVAFAEEAKEQIALYTSLGWDKMPICMAKAQMSLSNDAKVYGASKSFTITVHELRLSLSIGFLVALTGKIPTMPGLPEMPAANSMNIDEKGHIKGLF